MRWLEYIIFLALVVGLVKPVGLYLARVFERKPTFLDRALCPVETMLYRVFRIQPEREMSAAVYMLCFILFTVLGTVLLFAVLLLQAWLPGGPHDRYLTTPMTVDLAVNTAVSFATTTTWQAYGGETTLRYLAQVFGLAAQNFLAGAAGLAVGIAFIRGFARERSATIGNFWFDLVRATLWVLLPLSLIWQLGLGLAGRAVKSCALHRGTHSGRPAPIHRPGTGRRAGVYQELGHQRRRLLQRQRRPSVRESDAAHELPGLLAIAVLPASLTITFGLLTNRPRSGWVLLAVMVVIFTARFGRCVISPRSRLPRDAGGTKRFRRKHGRERRCASASAGRC